MSFCVSKINRKLIFNDLGGYQTRNPSTIWCIQKADEKYNWNDFNEIVIYTEDYEKNNNYYTYSKHDNYNNLVPDFNFHSWPEVGINDYEKFVKEIDNAGLNKYEINKVGWIGNTNTNIIRKKLLEIGDNNKDLFDIFSMNWIQSGNVHLNSTKYISTPELVKKYSILIDIEGNGYSGRLKHLLWSHRPLLLVDRPHKEFFFEFLKEWEHYIPVKRDLSDLIEKTKWCLDNYDKALIIAENAFQFSKLYLTRDACYDKWNNIICNLLRNSLRRYSVNTTIFDEVCTTN
jgi:hypothetical protein